MSHQKDIISCFMKTLYDDIEGISIVTTDSLVTSLTWLEKELPALRKDELLALWDIIQCFSEDISTSNRIIKLLEYQLQAANIRNYYYETIY